MKIQLNNQPRWEYSVGDLLSLYPGGLNFNVGIAYNEETGKYEPISEKKDATETVLFSINKKLFEKKYRSRYMLLYKEETPTQAELKTDFDETFALFLNQRRYGLSNHLALVLNYYDPLYNYDRHEVYNEDMNTSYEGTETDKTDYTGSEKNDITYNGSEKNDTTYSGTEKNTVKYEGTETNDLRQSGAEQVGNVGYNLDTKIGKQTDENYVTGYNEAGTFNPESKTETTFEATSQTVPTRSHSISKTTGADGLVNTSITASGGTSASGRIDKTDIENVETHTFDNRVDRNKRSFENRQDVNQLEFTNRKDTQQKSFTDRSDNAVKSFENRSDSTTKSFEDRVDKTHRETNNHLYGNIGVTTSMALVLEQYQLNELYDFAEKTITDFMNEYTFVM